MAAARTFNAHGKLLLTAEYLVLDGATALAVPTKLGQSLSVAEGNKNFLRWDAYDYEGNAWASVSLDRRDWIDYRAPESHDFKSRLLQLLHVAENLRPGSTKAAEGKRVTTRLEFDRHWGLGSSSTLVHCLAEWLEVDAYALLEMTFGGSGYDLACAAAEGPILYEIGGRGRAVNWQPEWVNDTVFVYRNQKQNSREGISHYRRRGSTATEREAISRLTSKLVSASYPREALPLLRTHEAIIGELTEQTPVGEELFSDFPGVVKSLGAWGGDFVWAVAELEGFDYAGYFNAKGYPTVIGYKDMTL